MVNGSPHPPMLRARLPSSLTRDTPLSRPNVSLKPVKNKVEAMRKGNTGNSHNNPRGLDRCFTRDHASGPQHQTVVETLGAGRPGGVEQKGSCPTNADRLMVQQIYEKTRFGEREVAENRGEREKSKTEGAFWDGLFGKERPHARSLVDSDRDSGKCWGGMGRGGSVVTGRRRGPPH